MQVLLLHSSVCTVGSVLKWMVTRCFPFFMSSSIGWRLIPYKRYKSKQWASGHTVIGVALVPASTRCFHFRLQGHVMYHGWLTRLIAAIAAITMLGSDQRKWVQRRLFASLRATLLYLVLLQSVRRLSVSHDVPALWDIVTLVLMTVVFYRQTLL